MSSHIGLPSETFIRRHMQDLLPGRTVVIAGKGSPSSADYWGVDGPRLILEEAVPASGPRRCLLSLLGILSGREGYARWRAVRSFLRRQRVSVILGEYLNHAHRWLGLAAELGIPLVAHAHGYDVSQLLRDDGWKARYRDFNRSAGIVTMSEASKARLTAIGVRSEKITVVPYGVDVPSAAPSRVFGRAVRCLAVGRMVGKKAPVLTLNAFRLAAEQEPALSLDFVGDGPLLPAVRQLVGVFGLGERVRLHGALPSARVQALMRDGDIFLQHSIVDPDTGDEEGLPVAILEAMAAGLPVVATRHAGIPEAVADGETGFLVDEGDSEAMGRRILDLATSIDLRRAMGERGWQRAGEAFSWERERAALSAILARAREGV
jgi:glycosyltransferase involved in cell wall biosynthesis